MMRLLGRPGTWLALLALQTWVSLAVSQSVAGDLPSCANPESEACDFRSNDDFEAKLSPCFFSACSPEDAYVALNITSIICDLPVRNISLPIRVYVIVATVFASVIISLRVLIKARGLAGGVGWDDWSIVIAVSFYIAAIGYKLGNAWARTSILCFYLRIFGTTHFRVAVLVLIALNLAVGFTFAMADALQCRPPSFFWKGWDGVHNGECVSLSAISWSHSVLNVVLDLAALGLAVWIVKGLGMRWMRKLTVIGMFVLGSAITIVSICRLQSLPQLSNVRNRTWNLAPVSYWSGIEMLAGLVCACLPALKSLKTLITGKPGTESGSSAAGYVHRSSFSNRRATPARELDDIFADEHAVASDGDDRMYRGNSLTELVEIPQKHN
ncbi:hypothetical protein F5X68DRAFT_244238 [Plectosphaerella plurivora]|uniref:Rhodopsin domain-containing protein n=1 Tax=Plectosphaerella plurivora TaxID=936078 RepID=A0A9P9AGF0_9PEZI|nr:hypothetical protein F5X68DRAFT_244238 [Plectosphaerella plurivora]